jgi:ATP-dependent exoDNAse (exonuclease V) alpha subunit
MLNYARQVLEAEGYTVRGACFTGKAADGLEADARIPSITLHRHLNALEKETGRHVPRENMQDKTSWNFDGLAKGEGREIWVVDEASMVDNTVMRSLLEAAKRKEAKVVFVGDDRQLPPVGAGNAYGTMVQTGQIAKVGLTEIRRQKDAGLLQSVKEAVAGDIQKSLKLLDNNIHEIRKPKARLNAIVKEYLALAPAERQETVILTAANKDRRAINRQIREELKKQNALADGREFTLTDRSGRKTTQEFAAGDKVIFLKNDNQLQVRNGQTGIVESCAGHRLTIRSGDRTIVVDTAKYNRLDHGYVVTSHKAQGITVDRAIIHLDSSQAQLNTRNAFYVDISRARHAVKIFTDDKGKIKKQVKDFAKKITSRDFPAPQEQPEKNFYQAVRTGAEKIFTQLRREQGKARER